MNNVWKNSFIVTDVETTGHHPDNNRIAEIACVVVQGGEIISEFDSLINPKQSIPPYISKITGISNKIAFKAPCEKDILPEIARIFDRNKAVFVAHNVDFDWNFVTHSFNRNFIPFQTIPKICTYKLAKALLPNQQKKNVGALSNYFNIRISDRHRALGDARATAKILIELINIAEHNHNIYTLDDLINIQKKRSHSFKLNNSVFQKLKRKILDIPQVPGIYKYYDQGNQLIYVGESNNLYDRVNSYFTNGALNTRKMQELVNSINDIKWEKTNSELSALIYKHKLIQTEKPYFNKIHKESKKYPFIKITNTELFPSVTMSYDFEDDGSEYFGPFRNSSFPESLINIINKNFNLIKCELPRPIGTKLPCPYYKIDKCFAPCIFDVPENDYSQEVNDVRNFLNIINDNMIGSLETNINNFSDNLEHKKAIELSNDLIKLKKIYKSFKYTPASLNNNHYIFIYPNSKRKKLVDIFFIKSGRLYNEITVGIKQNLEFISPEINNFYLKDNKVNFNTCYVEEIRIINSWVNKNSDKGVIINIEKYSPNSILKIIISVIKNFNFD